MLPPLLQFSAINANSFSSASQMAADTRGIASSRQRAGRLQEGFHPRHLLDILISCLPVRLLMEAASSLLPRSPTELQSAGSQLGEPRTHDLGFGDLPKRERRFQNVSLRSSCAMVRFVHVWSHRQGDEQVPPRSGETLRRSSSLSLSYRCRGAGERLSILPAL